MRIEHEIPPEAIGLFGIFRKGGKVFSKSIVPGKLTIHQWEGHISKNIWVVEMNLDGFV